MAGRTSSARFSSPDTVSCGARLRGQLRDRNATLGHRASATRLRPTRASGVIIGTVLDVGCGTGEHALLAASSGHEVLGIDVAPTAIELAKKKAADRHLNATFRVGDALRLADLGAQFDTVLDCGLFHVFNDEERHRFVDSLAGVMRPGGRYHMLCFSDRQPGDWGPRRVTEGEIRASFSDGWVVDSVEPSVLEITIDPAGAAAWLAAVTGSECRPSTRDGASRREVADEAEKGRLGLHRRWSNEGNT